MWRSVPRKVMEKDGCNIFSVTNAVSSFLLDSHQKPEISWNKAYELVDR